MHHDSAGFLTFVRVLDGIKLWIWLEWVNERPTASELKAAAEAIDREDYVNIQYSEPAPWYPISGDDAYRFNWKVYLEKRDEHERYRRARWMMRAVERGTTL